MKEVKAAWMRKSLLKNKSAFLEQSLGKTAFEWKCIICSNRYKLKIRY